MIKSMAAFANHQIASSFGLVHWELRSVNQRFLEMNFRLPESLRDLETALRELAKQALQRGKVDATLRYQSTEQALPQKIIINKSMVNELSGIFKEISAACNQPLTIDAMKVLTWPGVIEAKDTDMTELKKIISNSFATALNELDQTRAREGSNLANLISQRLNMMTIELEKIKNELPVILKQHKEKIAERMRDLQINCAEERLEQELALLLQKSDVTEEIDRLDTHIQEMQRVLLQANTPASGRRFDFLAQEMHREANTLGSKSIHIMTSQAALELKILIEQIREQVQNIE